MGSGTTDAPVSDDPERPAMQGFCIEPFPNAGILLTNGGNAIVNGFLGETIRLGSDEVRLYQNEIKLLMPAIPEPSTYLMTILGLGAIGVLARKRRQIPRRNRINDLHASPAALLPS